MKIRAAWILSLAVLTGCQQKPLTEYSSTEGKFKAIFPGEPKVTSTSAVGITVKMYSVESLIKSYMIGWSDMPIPEWESEGRTKSRLFDARDGALAAVKGKSNNTTKTILLADRFPGIEFGGSAEGKHLRARVYLVGHRMYQLLVVARSEDQLTSQESEDFFTAFQVIEPDSLLPSGSTYSVAGTPAFTNANPIKSTQGRFEANYPVKPKKFTRNIGGTEFTGYASESANGTCSVSYADLPIPGGEPAEKLQERLDAARQTAIADAKGTFTGTKEITLGDRRPGQEFAATIDDKHLRGRVYLIGNRLYQVTVQGDEAFAGSKEAAAFLSSFKLAK